MKKIIILSGRLYNTADNNVLNGILVYNLTSKFAKAEFFC